VASGVSVGAITAAGLSKFPIGQEAAAAQATVNAWLTITAPAIIKPWPGGFNQGYFLESGLYDPSGLKATLEAALPVAPLDAAET
jgi:hypothetical protein